MRRTMGTAAFILPLVALALGPWVGLGASGAQTDASSSWFEPVDAVAAPDALHAAPRTARGSAACNCRTVDVTLDNVVRDAKVKTGDARVVNFNVTYVSADYGDRDVDVDQEAEAISGDAIAGQIIAVDARGPGCVNVRVHASNHVEDAEVESGDATAINRSVVLLDPAVSQGDLDIDIEQEAEAHSGDAVAGQIIDVVGGNRVGRCGGGVDLTAVNEVLDTDVETGRAIVRNTSQIIRCAVAGCEAELRALLGGGAQLEVCSGSGCREADAKELSSTLTEEAARPDPEGETKSDTKVAAACSTPTPTPNASSYSVERPRSEPSPAPTPTPASASAPPEPSTSPTASPGATREPCATSSPEPGDAHPELIASGSEPTPAPAS